METKEVKAVIYNRTSTDDQNPENQLKDSLTILEELEIPRTQCEILEEQKSAWKNDDKREVFDYIRESIKRGKFNILIVWDLDRIYRNRKKLRAFLELCKTLKCEVYSFRQKFLREMNRMPEPWNEIIKDMMIQIMGWMAEDESNKKSDRVKSAVRRKDGQPTKSYKGNKWGRKSISKKTIEEVLRLKSEGLSIREICNRVEYWDKSNNKRKIGVGTVHKILKSNNPENVS